MAETAFGALSSAQKRVWASEISVAGRDQNFWMSNGFVGRNTADMTKPIQRITDLTKTERGDVCIMQLVAELQNDGVVGDNELTNNEEALFNESVEVRIDQLRHGVKSRGKMDEQKTVIRFRTVARDKLGFWLGDTIDEMMFLTASGRAYTLNPDGSTRGASQLPSIAFAADVVAATTGRIMHAGAATSEATLTASDKMSWNLLVKACATAKRKRLKPIREGGKGKEYYAVVMSTEQLRDLKLDPDYKSIVSNAGPRGTSNVLFNNAIQAVDGLILYDHQKVFNTLGLASSSKWGSGGTVDGAQALMLGSQALGLAMIGNAEYNEAEITDYGNRSGIGYGRMLGMLKPQFKSQYDSQTLQDFGVLSIKTAAAA
jgi:N4-gp56 family major capsid protein